MAKIRCIECKEAIKGPVFDIRFHDKNIDIYVIQDDGRLPWPCGYCEVCIKLLFNRDLDLLVEKALERTKSKGL